MKSVVENDIVEVCRRVVSWRTVLWRCVVKSVVENGVVEVCREGCRGEWCRGARCVVRSSRGR